MSNEEFSQNFLAETLTQEQSLSLIAVSLNQLATSIEGLKSYVDERNGIMVGIEKNIGEIANAISELKEEK